MRVLVTGGTGFIGSHVIRLLVHEGLDVAALVRPGSSRARLDDVPGVRIEEGDLRDEGRIGQLLETWQPQTCLHLAWYVDAATYLHAGQNLESLQASLGLLARLRDAGCCHVVMAGTCAEYDTDQGFLREDARTNPTTIYAATKLALCLIGQRLAEKGGFSFVWARLFYLYGPEEDPRRLVPALIRSLHRRERFQATAGEQVRDYLYVEDVAAALRTLVVREVRGVFNIASGVPVTIRQLMEAVGAIMKQQDLIDFGALPYRDWEPRFICGDNTRLRALGWKPQHSLVEGLTKTIDWWKCRLVDCQ